MTIYINSSPAQYDLVLEAILKMTYEDLEILADLIEFSRSKGKTKSTAKVNGKVLYNAVFLSLQSVRRKNKKVGKTPC